MTRKQLIAAVCSLMLIAPAAPGALLAQDGGTLPVPSGQLVAGDDTGLFTFLADGSAKTYLIEETGCWLRDGAWSPDGSQLLYTRICGGSSPTDWHAAERSAAVFVYDAAAQTSRELIPIEGEYQDYAGGWSPDGTQVMIYSNRQGDRYNLYVYNLVSGEIEQITDFDGDVGRVSWDPTGRYLLYNRYIVETDAVRWEVRALDTTNQNEIRVAVGLTPAWSPDGQWIAFATEGETADVFVMPAACIRNNMPCDAAAEARNITYTPKVSERAPLWSPDQTQIAYLRDTNPDPNVVTWDIYRQDLRTGLLANLTNTPDISERHSAWQTDEAVAPVAVESVLPVVLRVTSNTANLRAEPTTNSNIVGVVNRGQIVFVQGANPARDWYRITLPEDGSTAWLFAELTQVVNGDPASVPEIAAD